MSYTQCVLCSEFLENISFYNTSFFFAKQKRLYITNGWKNNLDIHEIYHWDDYQNCKPKFPEFSLIRKIPFSLIESPYIPWWQGYIFFPSALQDEHAIVWRFLRFSAHLSSPTYYDMVKKLLLNIHHGWRNFQIISSLKWLK